MYCVTVNFIEILCLSGSVNGMKNDTRGQVPVKKSIQNQEPGRFKL